MSFYVRTALEPEAFASAIRRETAALDPNLPIRELKTMRDQIDENTANERLLSMLTGGFAGAGDATGGGRSVRGAGL